LTRRGVKMIGPDSGDTACGEEGEGRMCEPSYIADVAMKLVGDLSINHPSGNIASKKSPTGSLVDKRVIITSGPTIEPIDKVRFIANRSSGKQGHAIAAALAGRGASVTLVSGPVNESPPSHVNLVPVTTAAEMLSACTDAIAGQPIDIAICAAAVSDWRVTSAASKKLKKPIDSNAKLLVELSQNPDILANLSNNVNRPKLVIGFAAETENLIENATAKRHHKGCDWMIANQVGDDDDPVFGSSKNKALMITELGVETWPQMLKTELAEKLADRIEAEFS
jgi:phosphopantothenoylcysteine decarboxylase/phosphopantothenate--cysteine ligase